MMISYQESHESVSDFISRIMSEFRSIYGYRRNYGFFRFRRGVQKRWLRERLRPNLLELAWNMDDATATWEDLVEYAHDAEWLFYLFNPRPWQDPVSYYNDGQFNVDRNRFAIVYTDGCCLRNGQPGAQAGIGVWFGENHFLNVSEPVPPYEPATNNVAEIRAVLKAIEIAKEYGAYRLVIRTDSQYLISSLTNWIIKWLQNGWTTANGHEIRHKDLYREYLQETEDMTIRFEHVRGHQNEEGNLMADSLAKRGALRYRSA